LLGDTIIRGDVGLTEDESQSVLDELHCTLPSFCRVMSIRTDGKLVTSKKGRSDARVAVGQAIEIAGDELTPIRR
jgi:hypothetical protein